MEIKLISKGVIDYLGDDKNKLFLLNKINDIANEVVLKEENKETIINLLVQKLDNANNMNSFTASQKRSIIETGLSVALNLLAVKVLKQEKEILEKENILNQALFLEECSKEIKNLQIRISDNKNNFLELEEKSKNLSLNNLANKINEFHNPNRSSEVSDSELDNLLNGGTIEF